MPRVKKFSDAVLKSAMKYDSSRSMDDKIKAMDSENREFSLTVTRFVDDVTEKIS